MVENLDSSPGALPSGGLAFHLVCRFHRYWAYSSKSTVWPKMESCFQDRACSVSSFKTKKEHQYKQKQKLSLVERALYSRGASPDGPEISMNKKNDNIIWEIVCSAEWSHRKVSEVTCISKLLGLPWRLNGKEPTCQWRRCGFNPWVQKILWRRKWEPPPVFFPGKSFGQRSLAGYSPWGCKESDMQAHKCEIAP